jgi:hypothetical protein
LTRIGRVRSIGMSRFQSCIAALFIVVAVPTFSSSKKPAPPKKKSPVALTQEQRAIHARITPCKQTTESTPTHCDRLNFALQMSNGQVGGVKFDAAKLLSLGVLTDIQSPEASGEASHDPEMRGAERAISLLEYAA